MKIIFKIETISYIVAEIKTDRTNFVIGHSGLYEDKFQELLNEFYLIYKTLKGEPFICFPRTSEILWKDDFVNYKWIISIDSPESSVNIQIVESYPSNIDYKKILINEDIFQEDLFNDIYSSLHQMFLDYGFIGYKINWDVGNFPIGEYLSFKADKFHLNLSLINENDDSKWKNKVASDDELKILLFE